MSKVPFKKHALGLPEIKNQQQQGKKFDETCRVRICTCKANKNRKINDDKDDTSKKSKTHNQQ